MAECNRQTLMDAAACFNCLTEEDKATLKLQLLCDIKEEAAGDVNSIIAGTGISVSSATGDVTVSNTGVLSLAAGNNISVSSATGNSTVSMLIGSQTTAQLLALTTPQSLALGIAYCSDCITSTSNTPTGRGGMVYWNGSLWLTIGDRMPITTDFLTFVLNCGRFNRDLGYTPAVIMGGDQPGQSGLSVSSNIQSVASGATIQSIDTTGPWTQMASLRAATTGTTAGAIARLLLGNPVTPLASGTPGIFSIGMVCCHYGTDSSPSASDSYHVRYGVETFQNSATAALQADMASLITDQQNLLGLGASGANWRALTRIAGTTLDYVDTGIPIGDKVWLVATIEPVSGTTCRFRVATAGDLGTPFTTHADRSASGVGAAIQSTAAIARGSVVAATNRASRRRFMKWVGLRFDASATSFVS